MIDHRRKFIFVHIPKNAGTTVEFMFGAWGDKNNKQQKEKLVGLISVFDKFRFGLWGEKEWQHLIALQIRNIVGGRDI